MNLLWKPFLSKNAKNSLVLAPQIGTFAGFGLLIRQNVQFDVNVDISTVLYDQTINYSRK